MSCLHLFTWKVLGIKKNRNKEGEKKLCCCDIRLCVIYFFSFNRRTRNDKGIFNKMRNETNSFVAMRIKMNLFIDRRKEEEEENYKVGFFHVTYLKLLLCLYYGIRYTMAWRFKEFLMRIFSFLDWNYCWMK